MYPMQRLSERNSQVDNVDPSITPTAEFIDKNLAKFDMP